MTGLPTKQRRVLDYRRCPFEFKAFIRARIRYYARRAEKHLPLFSEIKTPVSEPLCIARTRNRPPS